MTFFDPYNYVVFDALISAHLPSGISEQFVTVTNICIHNAALRRLNTGSRNCRTYYNGVKLLKFYSQAVVFAFSNKINEIFIK